MLTKSTFSFLALSLTSSQTVLITIWTLTMISLPIVDWKFGWEGMIGAIIAGVLAQAGAVTAILWGTWGSSKTIQVAIQIMLLGFAAEAIGSHTGFIFGDYHYTDALRPQLFHVPLLIPLAWLMMIPPSWGIAQAISSRLAPGWQAVFFVGISALAMTAWDLFLDPQMVNWGLWIWENPSGFFGIPWHNYLGWLLVSAAITLIIRPRQLPVAPLILIYTITWLLQTVGLGIFWEMPGPALVGGIIMGALTIFSWRSHRKNRI
jgi:putative membrane protein